MAPGNKPVIVRRYTDPDGPTGESTILVDSNGRHWREVFGFSLPQGTGERRASFDPRTGQVTEE